MMKKKSFTLVNTEGAGASAREAADRLSALTAQVQHNDFFHVKFGELKNVQLD
jgi:hypothetical protein